MHNKQSGIYIKMGWNMHQLDNLQRLAESVDLSKIKTHHDIACGVGDFVNAIVKKYAISSSGSDISNEMISIAKSRYPNNKFFVMDMCDLRLKEPVDLITINYFSINMVPEESGITKTIKAASKYLNEGGYFVFDFSTKGFVDNANIHEFSEKNGVIIKEDIVSQDGKCLFELSWLTSKDGINYIKEKESYTEVSLPVDKLRNILTSNQFNIISISRLDLSENETSELDSLNNGIYVIAQKIS